MSELSTIVPQEASYGQLLGIVVEIKVDKINKLQWPKFTWSVANTLPDTSETTRPITLVTS